MRVLVVDQDSALLTAITQLLGEYFTIDAVTTKADCLDLVRANEFEVIVAGERLEDGSGLELLGQLGRSRPDMLRIFAVDRERLKLLKGRLGPFGLFRTLSYPIEPRQLLAALSAAAGIEEEMDHAEELARPDPPPPPPPPPPRQTPPPTPVEVTVRAVREVHDSSPAPQLNRGPRQPTPEALAVGARLASTSQAKAFPLPFAEPNGKRSAFLVAAGVAVVIGSMAVVLHVSNTPDRPPLSSAILSPQTAHDPPEVVKLVADTETAFQQDDYKTARTDIAALQQIAPTHPRLAFFEALLAKHDAGARDTGSSSFSRWFSRHTSAPKPKVVAASQGAGPKSASQPAAAATFSGKTLEDSNSAPGSGPQVGPIVRAASANSVTTTGSVTATPQDPQIVRRIPPEYPNDAAEKGIEGAVDLSFRVSPRGDVEDVTVVHSEPSSVFNRAAIAAVRRWKYQPRKVDGIAVDARVQLRMTFKLDDRG
jgi:protein TonB